MRFESWEFMTLPFNASRLANTSLVVTRLTPPKGCKNSMSTIAVQISQCLAASRYHFCNAQRYNNRRPIVQPRIPLGLEHFSLTNRILDRINHKKRIRRPRSTRINREISLRTSDEIRRELRHCRRSRRIRCIRIQKRSLMAESPRS